MEVTLPNKPMQKVGRFAAAADRQGVRPTRRRNPMRTPLETHVCDFVAGLLDDPHELREWAGRHDALPIMFDMGGFYALRPPLIVVSCGWQSIEQVDIEEDERIKNLVRYRASQLYAGLAHVAPVRPANAQTCSSCKGTGRCGPEVLEVICYCGNLGWLPPTRPN